MFSTINDIINTIGSIFPRIKKIHPYQKGLKFIWGSRFEIIDPGWTIVWPLSTDFFLYPTVIQTFNLNYQVLTTLDLKTVVLSAAFLYKIESIENYAVNNYQTDETVIEIVSSILREEINKSKLSDILDMIKTDSLNQGITNKAYNELKPYGIAIESFRLTDLALSRVISLANPGQSHNELLNE